MLRLKNLHINITILLLLFVTIFGGFLRFYQLSKNPPGLYVDEASILYNAYSIAQTAKDEYGKFMPYWFESYHDFKPPVYIYITAALVKVFGLHDIIVRLPSAVAGTLSILCIYQLSLELILLTKSTTNTRPFSSPQSTALIAASFFAISPWSLQFSRAGFEANLALFFTLAATSLVIYSFRTHQNWYLPAGLLYLVSISTYHSARLFVPLLLLSFPCLFFKEIKSHFKPIAQAIIVTSLIALPLIPVFTNPQSLIRLQGNTYLSDLSPTHALAKLGHEYINHFDTNYLFFAGDQNGRHSVRYLGMLYYFDFPFILIGLFVLLFKFPHKPKLFLLAWLLLAPLPAAIVEPNPHALRSLNILPAWIFLSALGLQTLLTSVSNLFKKRIFRYGLIVALVLSISYNFGIYLDEYWVRYPDVTALDWNNGYKQTVELVKTLYPKYQTIYINRDLPLAYLGLYLPIPPQQYQSIPQKYTDYTPSFDKFVFFHESWTLPPPSHGQVLIVAPPWQKAPDLKEFKSIKLINGDDLFYLWEERASS